MLNSNSFAIAGRPPIGLILSMVGVFDPSFPK